MKKNASKKNGSWNWDTLSLSQLRELTGLGDERHRQLAKDGHIPKAKRGYYDAKPTVKGIVSFYQGLQQRTSSQMVDVRLARERDKARQERISADEAEGKVIRTEAARRAILHFVIGLKSKQIGLPRRMAQQLSMERDPVKIEEVLETALRQSWEGLTFELEKLECPKCKASLTT